MIVKVVEYESPSVARKLKFRISLPAAYESSGKQYPVLYLLHGFSGDYTSWNTHRPEIVAEPYDLILVQPDYGNSWCINWSESAPGQKNNWEDAMTRDLIPVHRLRHYRTVVFGGAEGCGRSTGSRWGASAR